MSRNPGKMTARTLLLAALLLPLAARDASGQETLQVRRALRGYDLTVRVKSCGEDEHRCAGPARLEIYRKGAATPLQVLSLPHVEIYRDSVAHNPAAGPGRRGPYAEVYSFVGDDFNFDGDEDLAVCNGRNGGYGGPSYTIYLFERRSGRFVESRPLSRLNEGVYLGLFSADPKRKRLTASSKNGCCHHETEVYAVVGGRPVLLEKTVEDATPGSGAGEGFVLVTTKKRVKGRWVVTKKKERLKGREPGADGGPN